jgi:hypothetical protein
MNSPSNQILIDDTEHLEDRAAKGRLKDAAHGSVGTFGAERAKHRRHEQNE